MEGISVVVCCFNSAKRIEPTLNHLLRQKELLIESWEIIIVDNASTDDTAEVVLSIYNSYTGTKPTLKVVKEASPGLSNARVKGISEATFDYVVFCDDDNWLSDNYLSKALTLMKSNKSIAVLGGMGEPVFEVREPPYFWINQFHFLAVGPQSDKNESDVTNTRKVVYGAGMVINRCLFNELLYKYDFTFQTSDRKGNLLFSGGDYELCTAFVRIGYKIFWSDDLKFKHYIPKERTTIAYYKKLTKGLGLSYPAGMVYYLNKNNYNNYKFDYRYLILRYLKNVAVDFSKLFMKGYFFSKNKYKYIQELQGLYTSYGALVMTLKIKNKIKNNFIKSKLFLEASKNPTY